MKKIYTSPNFDCKFFDEKDVICSSGEEQYDIIVKNEDFTEGFTDSLLNSND